VAKKSGARLDREISKALGKKGKKLWPLPEKRPRTAPLKPPAPEKPRSSSPSTPEAKREAVCRFCKQQLYWAPDGHFECGGEGEGACSFWSAIGDYDRAGRPKDVESWLDGWLQREMGTDWAGIGWDRAAHAKAIRAYFKLVEP